MNPLARLHQILGDVAAERVAQVEDHPPTEDTHLNAFDWHEIVKDYSSMARRKECLGEFAEARRRLVQVAALTIAHIEALDRRNDEPSSILGARPRVQRPPGPPNPPPGYPKTRVG